jgi:hypothetical protein
LASTASVVALHDEPEVNRRASLARFWALVDYSPEIASPAVISALISSFNARADYSVMQSVLNALKDMNFADVLHVVLADVSRLLRDGDWLGTLLGLWGGDIADEHMPEFQRQIQAVGDDAARDALAAATEKGLQQRERWAIHADIALRG